MDQTSYVYVMYQGKPGVFDVSEEAWQEYCSTIKERAKSNVGPRRAKDLLDLIHRDSSDVERDDEVMVKIVQRLGSRANGPYADIRLAKIPRHYRHRYFEVVLVGSDMSPGREKVRILLDKYKVDNALRALQANGSSIHEKVVHVTEILTKDIEKECQRMYW